MPSIGTKSRTKDLLITTKINGPTNVFMFDPKDVLKEVQRLTSGDIPAPPKELANLIAQSIFRQVSYDPNVLWVDCEVVQQDGILYTAIAERQFDHDGNYEDKA